MNRIILEPLTLRGVTFKNRVIHSPMVPGMASNDGCVTRELIRFHRASARGGAAVVTLGNATLDMEHYRDEARQVDLASPRAAIGLGEFVRGVERYGAVADIEINHCGIHTHPTRSTGAPMGPSALRPGDIEMTPEDIRRMVERYAKGALLCRDAGFRMVMLHGAHGNLLAQFASPLTNRRTDGYGGTPKKRARFAREVIDEVRRLCGEDMVIEYRISGNEYVVGGLDLKETLEFVECLEDRVDLFHVSGGMISVPGYNRFCFPNCYMEQGINLKYAREFKKHTSSAVAVVGGLLDMDFAERALEEGACDMAAFCRPLMADPEMVRKYAEGRADEITPCIRCGYCFGVNHESTVTCAVNPLCGQEDEFPEGVLPAAPRKKKVAVVGGGPGGMQAARTAASRGHSVTLFEKESRLGGHLITASALPVKKEFRPYMDWSVRETKKTVRDIRLGTEATPEMIRAEGFDAVIAAVGAVPAKLPVPADGTVIAYTCDTMPEEIPGEDIVVIGGGMTGYETACHFCEQGKRVTVLDMSPLELLPMGEGSRTTRSMSLGLLDRIGVRVTEIGGARVEAIEHGSVAYTVGGERRRIPADAVIWAVGLKPERELAESFRQVVPACNFYKIGDCVNSAKIGDAVHGGFDAAYAL